MMGAMRWMAMAVLSMFSMRAVHGEILKHNDSLKERAWRANGYLGGRHTFTSLCQDRKRSCANWAKAGECTGGNGDHVKRLCPMSCSQCHAGMHDHEHCADWARQGACSTNPDYMRLNCAITCSWALGVCQDLDPGCPRMARRGRCTTHPETMLTLCSESCGICRSSCHDLDASCPNWILDDWATDNPQTVMPRCSQSAGVCEFVHAELLKESADETSEVEEEEALRKKLETEGESAEEQQMEKKIIDEHFPVCRDKNATLCAIWTEQACSINPYAVIRECPRMCSACTSLCTDHVDSCHHWVEKGLLTPHLYHLCPATAGICSRIEEVLRSRPTPPISGKDEL
jgi:hypothetical protein